jgi:hypothetical protein
VDGSIRRKVVQHAGRVTYRRERAAGVREQRASAARESLVERGLLLALIVLVGVGVTAIVIFVGIEVTHVISALGNGVDEHWYAEFGRDTSCALC